MAGFAKVLPSLFLRGLPRRNQGGADKRLITREVALPIWLATVIYLLLPLLNNMPLDRADWLFVDIPIGIVTAGWACGRTALDISIDLTLVDRAS